MCFDSGISPNRADKIFRRNDSERNDLRCSPETSHEDTATTFDGGDSLLIARVVVAARRGCPASGEEEPRASCGRRREDGHSNKRQAAMHRYLHQVELSLSLSLAAAATIPLMMWTSAAVSPAVFPPKASLTLTVSLALASGEKNYISEVAFRRTVFAGCRVRKVISSVRVLKPPPPASLLNREPAEADADTDAEHLESGVVRKSRQRWKICGARQSPARVKVAAARIRNPRLGD